MFLLNRAKLLIPFVLSFLRDLMHNVLARGDTYRVINSLGIL